MSSDRLWGTKHEQQHNKIDVADETVEKLTALGREDTPKPVEVPPTRMQRKFKRIFGSGHASSKLFIGGFTTGCMIGGVFGGLIGLFTAVQYRSFAALPLSMAASGVSFGFFMGMRMVIVQNQ